MYGFAGAGPAVKTLPCCSKCTRLCAVAKARHHRVYGFRKCGRRDNIAQEKPHAPRLAERVSKDTGVGGSRTPKAQVVGHASLCARHGTSNGHGTAQESIRMHGCALSAIPPPLRCSPSRSHAPFLSVSRTEEWQKKPWGFSPGRVSLTSLMLPYLSNPTAEMRVSSLLHLALPFL